MKKLITFVFVFSLVLYWSGTTAYAKQGRGQGRGPSVTGGQNRGPSVDRRNEDRREERREDKAAEKRDDRREDKAEKRDDKFEDRLERNPELRTRLERMLPAGTNLRTASSGFKNQGQFIAALHVSKNLDIPFNQLKSRMTGPNAMSLGQAIHDLKPNIPEKDARREVERAEKQAKETEKAKGNT